jgi:hypothetical protein
MDRNPQHLPAPVDNRTKSLHTIVNNAHVHKILFPLSCIATSMPLDRIINKGTVDKPNRVIAGVHTEILNNTVAHADSRDNTATHSRGRRTPDFIYV